MAPTIASVAAGLLPLSLPKGRQPSAFGVLNEAVPEGFLPQLAYPFKRRAAD